MQAYIRLLAATAVPGLIMCAMPAYAAQTFDGATIRGESRFPDRVSVGETSNAVVGSGVEFTFVEQGLTADFSGSVLTVINLTPGFFTNSDFNGLVFTDINSMLADFTGVTLTSSSAGFEPIATFDSDNIFLNFAGIDSTVGQTASFNVLFAPAVSAVPEPASWAMMLIGFGAVGLSMRYRRRKVSVSYV